MKNKNLLIVAVVAAVVLLGFGVWAGVAIFGKDNAAGPSPFSAVYLSTGDIYYGKLRWFPWPHLTNVWLLQRGQDAQGQVQLGIAPFTSSFWGPMDELDLNPSQIIFWTRLRNDSQLAQALANPSAVQPIGSGQGAQSGTSPVNGTSSFKGPSTQPPAR